MSGFEFGGCVAAAARGGAAAPPPPKQDTIRRSGALTETAGGYMLPLINKYH
jgi:hypothetical protein